MTLTRDGSGSYRHPDDPGEPTTNNPRLSVTDAEAEVLASYVGGLDVLEIGTGLGVSTRALASTAASVVTVDVDPWVWDTIWPDLPANVTGTKRVPNRLFDVVFIDGDHSTDAVRYDVGLARAHCRPGGVLLAHDTNYGGVVEGLGDGWEFLDTAHGIGIYRVPA